MTSSMPGGLSRVGGVGARIRAIAMASLRLSAACGCSPPRDYPLRGVRRSGDASGVHRSRAGRSTNARGEPSMSRMLGTAILIGPAVPRAGSARADRLGKGRALVEIGIGGHSVPNGELGGQLGYFRFLSDQWTLGVS